MKSQMRFIHNLQNSRQHLTTLPTISLHQHHNRKNHYCQRLSSWFDREEESQNGYLDIKHSFKSKTRKTDYFDTVYLHDVEFIADSIADINEEVQPTRFNWEISMGLLIAQGPPDWHPAPDGLKSAARDIMSKFGKEASKASASFCMRNYTTAIGWQTAGQVK
ncbi:hypothetical protein E3Q15_02083 [Wallemia mellicola]|nr:hypothetical protein E3Q15_02083 [Wallemia mellicola]